MDWGEPQQDACRVGLHLWFSGIQVDTAKYREFQIKLPQPENRLEMQKNPKHRARLTLTRPLLRQAFPQSRTIRVAYKTC